jgi:hypothetical protein
MGETMPGDNDAARKTGSNDDRPASRPGVGGARDSDQCDQSNDSDSVHCQSHSGTRLGFDRDLLFSIRIQQYPSGEGKRGQKSSLVGTIMQRD